MHNTNGFRKCSTCKRVLPLNNFHKNRYQYHGGYSYECKECVLKRAKLQYKKISKRKTGRPYIEALPRLDPGIRAEHKRCPTCMLIKDIDEFYNSSARHDGKDWQCKDCENKRKREYQARRRTLSVSEQKSIRKRFRRMVSAESRQNEALDVLANGVYLRDKNVKLPDDIAREDLMDKPNILITTLSKSH